MRRVYLNFGVWIMFGGVKITLILCLTIVVSCVLFISYNEYTDRYSLLTTSDNSLYIFDKKSTVLNKCDGKSCVAIETKLPTKTSMNFDPSFQQSKLFESNKPMTSEIAEKKPEESAKTVEAAPAEKEGLISLNDKSDKKSVEEEESKEEAKEPKKESEHATNENTVAKSTTTSEDDEFVE